MAAPFVPVPVPIDRTAQSTRRGSNRTTTPQHSTPRPKESCGNQEYTQSKLEQSGILERCGSECLGNKELSGSGQDPCGKHEHSSAFGVMENQKSTGSRPGEPDNPDRQECSVSSSNGALDRTSTPEHSGSSAPESLGEQDLSGSVWAFTPTVLGYEVMEERAKFTVYKLLVRKSVDESWVIFRRYTDFARLNDKLKDSFPDFRLSLPPKRWFKDNYEADFLQERMNRLQSFLQNLIAHRDIAHCLAVREFLCLDDPPGPFDSLEESRAFCETLEECNYRLQKELLEKQRELHNLRRTMDEQQRTMKEQQRVIDTLQERISSVCLSPAANLSLDIESSAAEADQSHDSSQLSVCWCVPFVQSSPLSQINTLQP
ncbi:hypothetical protein DNTS_015349 [Danionella cerebrum]|uniref:Sorting nexin-16 n=1 Tax=Danionella cerebrum TaxID=2873325 RepID=A0A553NWV0_9TELE|nr:hypothetical protein DNTS_015349 [Danionella translucida]